MYKSIIKCGYLEIGIKYGRKEIFVIFFIVIFVVKNIYYKFIYV